MAETVEAWFGRVIEKEGRLLRVTTDTGAGGAFAALAFTFDVGTVRVTAEGGTLAGGAFPATEGEAGTTANEDDPWWTVIGNELHRVTSHDAGVIVQFRPDNESPKIVQLEAAPGGVRVRTVV